jgi:hypothetical protein
LGEFIAKLARLKTHELQLLMIAYGIRVFWLEDYFERQKHPLNCPELLTNLCKAVKTDILI